MKSHWLLTPWIPILVVTAALRAVVLAFPSLPGGGDSTRDLDLQAYLLHPHLSRAVPGWTADEAAHLADVRDWLTCAWALLALSTILVMGGGLVAWRSPHRRRLWAHGLRSGSRVTAAGLTLAALAALVDFSACFRLMHRLMFREGTWYFDGGTWLVDRFPASFWQQATALLVGTALLFTLGIRLMASLSDDSCGK